MSILIYFERKKTGDSLLQMMKKLCSIDSVNFEQKLKKTRYRSNTLQKYLYHNGKKYSSKMYLELTSRGEKFRSLVRKKFHPETETKESSIFIQTMNEKD